MSAEEREALRVYERNYFRVYRTEWRKAHPEQSRAASRQLNAKYYKKDPMKHRQRVAAARYSLKVAEYLDLIARSGGRCEACGQEPATGKVLQVDHDHDTGLIRGVLCSGCNSALGRAGDNSDRLRRLVAYLEREPSSA
jgi:hypothetical protein